MQTTENPALEAAHQAFLECTEMFRAIRAASENGGDYLTLADIGERIASAAADALSSTS
jgi:hypothetical protein